MKLICTLSIMMIALSAAAQKRNLEVTVVNSWDKAKADEPVVVKLSEVKKLNFKVKSATVTIDGKEVACQLDDMDGDLVADELVFLADIPARTTQRYSVSLSADGVQKQYAPRTYCYMGINDKKGKHPEVTAVTTPGNVNVYSDLYPHGAEFESELTGYRLYFDHRQNIDIYGKQTRRLELADTHFYTTAEQMQQGYGNDVLWAGNSIGCGSFKRVLPEAQRKPGELLPTNWDNVALRSQRVIASGPLRAVVEADDRSETFHMRQYYIIYAGHRECKVTVRFDHAMAADETYCTGVQKVGATPTGMLRNDGLAASWGGDYPDMGKKDLYAPENVGLAVCVPSRYVKQIVEDELNYLYLIGGKGMSEMHYYVSFCADKEKQGYHTARDWFDSLDGWKAMMENPVSVKVK